jgi:hypothetical protein
MGKMESSALISQASTNKILMAFNVPKTPKQVEKELRLNKLAYSGNREQ